MMKPKLLETLAVAAMVAPLSTHAISLALDAEPCPDLTVSAAARTPQYSARGSQKLQQGIVYLEQGRHMAAYTAFQEAIADGVADTLERASAYRQMALLMCRLGSTETCATNFGLAMLSGGPFDLPPATLTSPDVKQAFEQAQSYYAQRCTINTKAIPRPDASLNQVAGAQKSANTAEPTNVSLTMVSSGSERGPRKTKPPVDATLLIRVNPWARLEVDGKEIVTPPVKTLRIRPGEREISIKHPLFSTVLIEGHFKPGETWIVQQSY